MARHARCFKVGSKTGWLYVSRISYPQIIIPLCASEGILRIYLFTYTLFVLSSWEELCIYAYVVAGQNLMPKFDQFWIIEFANGPGDLGSILSRVILKTLKMVLDTFLFNTQQYKVHTRVKWSNPEKGVVHSATSQCRSHWKRSLLVALDNGRQLYIYIYIYIYINHAENNLFKSSTNPNVKRNSLYKLNYFCVIFKLNDVFKKRKKN